MFTYPITNEVEVARQRFPAIDQVAKIPTSGRSELEIVRLLDNTHYEHLDRLLMLLDDRLSLSGNIGKRILEQTDPIAFDQALSEFFIFNYLHDLPAVEARAFAPKNHSLTHHDIDVAAGILSARLEIYSPIDFFGFQLMKRLVGTLFKYLNVDKGFQIRLRLETSEDFFYVYEIGDESTVRSWLTQMERDVSKWIVNAREGDEKTFDGPNINVWYVAELAHVYEDSESRCISSRTATQSTDSRLFFEVGEPMDTAKSQWGKKLRSKLIKRQCGESNSEYLRMLVVDFSSADTGWPDFICWPKIAQRLSQTLKLIVDEIGPPLPYDALLPAQLSESCCFGKIIIMDGCRSKETNEFVNAASLDRPCRPQKADQTALIKEMFDHLN